MIFTELTLDYQQLKLYKEEKENLQNDTKISPEQKKKKEENIDLQMEILKEVIFETLNERKEFWDDQIDSCILHLNLYDRTDEYNKRYKDEKLEKRKSQIKHRIDKYKELDFREKHPNEQHLWNKEITYNERQKKYYKQRWVEIHRVLEFIDKLFEAREMYKKVKKAIEDFTDEYY